nr:DNA-binding transcriptional activator CusR [Raoultella sp. NCTC 9187]
MITESQFKVADLSIDLVSRKVSRAGNRIVLTSKEFSLLEFFIRHQGEVLPPLPDCLSGLGHEF